MNLRPIGPPMHFNGQVLHAALSPDGSRVVISRTTGPASIWDVATGTHAIQLIDEDMKTLKDAPTHSASFSLQGDRVVTGDIFGMMRVWDGQTGEAIGIPMYHSGPVHQVIFSAGKSSPLVLTISQFETGILGQEGKGEARVWFPTTGMLTGPPMHHRSKVLHASFSDDLKFVVTASADGTARVWSWPFKSPITPYLPHSAAVVFAGFTKSDQHIVTASADGTVRIWNVNKTGLGTRHANSAISAHNLHASTRFVFNSPRTSLAGKPHQLAVGMNGRYLLTVGRHEKLEGKKEPELIHTNEAQIWDTESGEVLSSILQHSLPINYAQFSPDGNTAVTVSGFRARLAEQTAVNSIPKQSIWSELETASDKPDGSSKSELRLWQTPTGEPLGTVLEHPGWTHVVSFSSDSKLLLSAGTGENAKKGEVRVWDVASSTLFCPHLKLPHVVTQARFSRDASRVLTVHGTGQAQVWFISAEGVTTVRLPFSYGERNIVARAAISPDGQYVAAVVGDRGDVVLWDIDSLTQTWENSLHQQLITTLEFSPDGQHLFTASMDGTARVWNAKTGTPVSIPIRQPTIVDAAFDSEGQLVATAGTDGLAQVWDLNTGIAVTPVLRHNTMRINQTHFSMNRNYIFTYEYGSIYAWNLSYQPNAITDTFEQAEMLASQRVDESIGLVPIDWSNGVDHLNRLLDRSPENSELYHQRGQRYAKQRQWSRALKDYDAAARLGAFHRDLWANRATAFLEMKQPDKSLLEYDKMIQAGFQEPALLRQRAMVMGLINPEKAIMAYSDFISHLPDKPSTFSRVDHPLAYFGRGSVYAEIDRWSEAISDYQAVFEKSPFFVQVMGSAFRAKVAQLYLGAGNSDTYHLQCEQLFEAFQKRSGPEEAVSTVLACLLPESNLLSNITPLIQAIALASKAEPTNVDYRLAHGVALYRTGQIREAARQLQHAAETFESLEHIDRSIRTAPVYAWLFLTMIHHELNNTTQAEEFLNKSSQWIRNAQGRLEQTGNRSGFEWDRRLITTRLYQEVDTLLKNKMDRSN